ncbi:uncharacterized protein LOC134534346 [Bacillus rossius redtenbacheri]|uniref:uncharacterized protein LOC134534346 n=1 Tax=Bacillus rossius redtenbacheri TaxID=93214 RepID=UPI002FDD9834
MWGARAVLAVSGKMAPRSAGSRDRPGDAHEAQEYDSTSRQAKVYLFTRPVDRSLPDSIEYHHWALVFVFQGDDVRTAEGFPDDSERLYPKYTKLFPEEEGSYYTLGSISTSPAAVLQKVRDNPCNGEKYTATWQNCQTWLRALTASLGDGVEGGLREFKTLREANPVVAAAGKKKSAKGFGSFSS